MQKPTITLIVSTYNQPEFLRLVLEGIANQSDTDFELILADDGSGVETKTRIDAFIKEFPMKTKHLWHEDNGFRKSTILNTALDSASNDYIVFLDGDCIPRVNFIAHHRALARKNRIVGCSRVLLDQTMMQHAIDNDVRLHRWSWFSFLGVRISGHINRVFPLVPLLLGPIRSWTPRSWKRVRGCNFGIYKENIMAIGGFDESFTGWGYEDSEMVARAINSGCLVRRGDHLATVLHLWHMEASRDEATSNKSSLEETVSTGLKTARSSSITA